MAYSIEAAIKAQIFDEVMVSTDDPTIARVAREYGASVPFMRSAENADDYATTADVICEVLTNYSKTGQDFALSCCIYATAPFTSPQLLHLAKNKLVRQGFDAVIPVIKFGFPIQRAVVMGTDQHIQLVHPEHRNTRSQDLEACYHDAGQFYFLKSEQLLKEKILFGENTGGIIVSELEAHDIDSEGDWKIAEMKYRLKKNGE